MNQVVNMEIKALLKLENDRRDNDVRIAVLYTEVVSEVLLREILFTESI